MLFIVNKVFFKKDSKQSNRNFMSCQKAFFFLFQRRRNYLEQYEMYFNVQKEGERLM